jgi:hypothetical protein
VQGLVAARDGAALVAVEPAQLRQPASQGCGALLGFRREHGRIDDRGTHLSDTREI